MSNQNKHEVHSEIHDEIKDDKTPFLKIVDDFCRYISKDHTEPGKNKCMLTIGIDSSDDVDKSGRKRDSTPSQVAFHWNGTVEQRDQIISVLMDHPFFNEGFHLYMMKKVVGDLLGNQNKEDDE